MKLFKNAIAKRIINIKTTTEKSTDNKIAIETKSETFDTKNLWKYGHGYQAHVTINSTVANSNEDNIIQTDQAVVYMEDLETRKHVYGICGECNEPGTGKRWCQPCNAKRFKKKFKSWSSENRNIDLLIKKTQLNAVHYTKCLEWIPFENFQNVTYTTRGNFGKIYSANWPEGNIEFWDIDKKKWKRSSNKQVAIKILDNTSSGVNSIFLKEIKFQHLNYLYDIVPCYGITRDPETNNYAMVLLYCENGNLRDYLNQYPKYIDYKFKIHYLLIIARGLLNIHNSKKVHKNLHSGNILIHGQPYISDLGTYRLKNDGVYGVLPYVAPEVLCGYRYTKAADIYSFGIIMNEFISEEIPYSDTSHDHILAFKICKGLRPKISEGTPKFLADLIMNCWDAKAENRPKAKELFQMFKKWYDEIRCYEDAEFDVELFKINENSGGIYSQIKQCDKIRKNEFIIDKRKSRSNLAHSQAIFTSRLIYFDNLPDPVNSTDPSSYF